MKTETNIKPYISNQFLSLDQEESMASIVVWIKGSTDSDAKVKIDNYRICIHDCNGMIALHGHLKTPFQRKSALHKIDTLIDELHNAKKHIVSHIWVSDPDIM